MQGIVIQGPTNYYKQIIPIYENIPNVVWSTWDGEPEENILFIKNATTPSNSGNSASAPSNSNLVLKFIYVLYGS